MHLLNRFLFIIVLSFAYNCERIVNTFVSDKHDVQIGASMDRQIKTSGKYKVLKNQEVREYVQNITNTILRSPLIKKKGVYPYKVTIIDDDDTINAFCTPGGYIYVYTGLMKALPNEASLASVLGHEIAHAEKRHSRQRMLSSIGIQIIIAIILNDSNSVMKDLGVRFAGSMAILANSRKDESESDAMSFQYLQSTNYYPGALLYFFESVLSQSNSKNKIGRSIQGLLSTHPLPESRLKKNKKRIEKAKLPPPSEENLFEVRYNSMLKKL